MAKKKKTIEEAIAEQDPFAYVEACNEEGLSPEEIDLYLYERYGAEIIMKKKKLDELKGRYKVDSNFDYGFFGEYMKSKRCRMYQIDKDTEVKKVGLKLSGLVRVMTGKSSSIPIDDAGEIRVGLIARDRYNDYLRKFRKS